jgi:hypothetical protein
MERRESGVRPKRQGRDRHSQRIEAHAELILSAVATKSDITLAETAGAAQGARRRRRYRHTLAVLQASQDHAQSRHMPPTAPQRGEHGTGGVV